MRTVSDDDFAELGVIVESLVHIKNINSTSTTGHVSAGLGQIIQRVRHILLRIDGVKE